MSSSKSTKASKPSKSKQEEVKLKKHCEVYQRLIETTKLVWVNSRKYRDECKKAEDCVPQFTARCFKFVKTAVRKLIRYYEAPSYIVNEAYPGDDHSVEIKYLKKYLKMDIREFCDIDFLDEIMYPN